MAKSLGQIHTVNIFKTVATAPGPRANIDLPGNLTAQLQHMCRAGNNYKLVGIDVSCATTGTLGGGQLTGHFRYYAPTKGRCAAFREAFDAMRSAFERQGISMTKNHQYDFRAPLNNHIDSDNVFRNQATLDGTNGLTLGLSTTGSGTYSIFDVYNKGVSPQDDRSASDLFTDGFATGVPATDFVLNDSAIYSGNSDVASTEYEMIPFTITWTPDTTDLASGFSWRPDPALYTAIMCGQLQLYIEEINLDGGAPSLELEMAFHVAGWKSIMGDPNRKRSRKKGKK